MLVNGSIHARNDECMKKRPAAVIQDLHFMLACLYKDVSDNDAVWHVYPGGCHRPAPVAIIEQAGRVEFSDKSFARVVDNKL